MLLELMMGFQRFVSAWNRLIFLRPGYRRNGRRHAPCLIIYTISLTSHVRNRMFCYVMPSYCVYEFSELDLRLHFLLSSTACGIKLSDTDSSIRCVLLRKVRLSNDKAPAHRS